MTDHWRRTADLALQNGKAGIYQSRLLRQLEATSVRAQFDDRLVPNARFQQAVQGQAIFVGDVVDGVPVAVVPPGDFEEMEVAVSAARSAVPDLPILASLTFTRDGKLQSGEGAAGAARALEAMGVDVAGANCSFGFASLLPICEEMALAHQGTNWILL